jgi:phospholipid/cholesterol/gamma-HCH transport system substrate-binding protein
MRIRLGVFALAALVLLGALILLFGSYPSLFKRHTVYTVLFNEAPGIGAGAPVRRSGVRIGEVKDVSLDDESGQVRVQISVERPFTLRHSEQATIVASLLGGDATIDFIPKHQEPDQPPLDRSPVDPGETLVGIRQANVSSLLSQAQEVVPDTQQLLKDIRDSLKRLDKLAPVAEDTLKEYQKLAKETREQIPELTKTNEEIRTTARSWGKLGDRVDLLVQTNQDKVLKTVDNANEVLNRISAVISDENQRNLTATLKNFKTSSETFPAIVKDTDDAIRNFNNTAKEVNDLLLSLQELTKPFAQRSTSIARNLDESTDKLNKMAADIAELLKAFNQGDGTLRRFLNDPSLYNHLDDAACQITRILPRVDRILKDAEVFADKIARHPDLIGVGGLVRPSAGLKESPFNPSGSSSFKPNH